MRDRHGVVADEAVPNRKSNFRTRAGLTTLTHPARKMLPLSVDLQLEAIPIRCTLV